MLSMLRRPEKQLVISEPDIQMALEHLLSLPFSKTRAMPKSWGREWVLQCVREALEARKQGALGEDSCVPVGPGLWAIVMPYGVDLAGTSETERRLQVWLLIRSVGTDSNSITEL